MSRPGRLRLVMAAGLAALASSCGSGSTPALPPPPVLVAGRPAQFDAVYVSAGDRQARLSPALVNGVAPLVAAKEFRPPEPLAEYGLAPARARLTYRPAGGAPTSLLVGGPTFDDHFIYVMYPGGQALYTVAAGQLDPVLALVGVVVPAPK